MTAQNDFHHKVWKQANIWWQVVNFVHSVTWSFACCCDFISFALSCKQVTMQFTDFFSHTQHTQLQ